MGGDSSWKDVIIHPSVHLGSEWVNDRLASSDGLAVLKSLVMAIAQLVRLRAEQNGLEQSLFCSWPLLWLGEQEGKGLSRDSAEGN